MGSWAEAEFERAQVTDERFRRVLVNMADSLSEHAEESYSQALAHAGRQAARRLVRNPEMTVDDLLAGHYEQTALRCGAHDVVLAVQDTTAFDYEGHVATYGLGPIGPSPDSLGVLGHGVLMVSRSGEPLGMLDVAMWCREKEEYGKRAGRKERSFEEKESVKWAEGMDAVRTRLPNEQGVVVVMDREGDVFDVLSWPRRPGMELLVRAAQPRKVLVEGKEAEVSLFEAARSAPVMGGMVVTVPPKGGQKERLARLEVRSARVSVRAPKLSGKAPVGMWVVCAGEAGAPKGSTPIEWVLLTTWPVETENDAIQCVLDYALRWRIERLHYTLKSGLKVERLQIDESQALMKALSVYYVVAWRLLWMTHVARVTPELPASEFVTAAELMVLEKQLGQKLATASEVLVAIARLGGYEWYRNAPAPGVKSLWLGLRRLTDMTAGYLLARAELGDVSQD